MFAIASDHDEAEKRARGAFDAQSSTDMGYVALEADNPLEILIEDVSKGGVSEVLVL